MRKRKRKPELIPLKMEEKINDLFSESGFLDYTEYDILYKQFEAAGLFQ